MRELRIHGRVQGVAFRASTVAEARRVGVVGFARNNADGSVTVVVDGPEQCVEQLIEWCQHGPRAARVDRVDECEVSVREEFLSFDVRFD